MENNSFHVLFTRNLEFHIMLLFDTDVSAEKPKSVKNRFELIELILPAYYKKKSFRLVPRLLHVFPNENHQL